MPDRYTTTDKCEHDYQLLYFTDHIRTYRCSKCGKDVYEELPHAL